MVGVILAAGNGTRLNINNCCKPLLKVNGIPLIEYSLDNLARLDIDAAYIVAGKHINLIKNTIGSNYKGIQLFYVHQAEQKGLINAFVSALNFLNEDVLLQLSDEIFINMKYAEIKNIVTHPTFDFYCGITFENDTERIKNNFSVNCSEDFIIKSCAEKPKEIINNIKGTGFCIFNAETIAILKSIYSEKDNMPRELCDFINYLVASEKKGAAFCIAEKELNINTRADLEEAQTFQK